MKLTLKNSILLPALAAALCALPAHAQTVTVAGYTSFSGPADLSVIGTTDWAKWGGDNNQGEFDHKSATGVAGGTAVGFISNITPYVQNYVGGNYNAPGLSGDLTTVTWSDGAADSANQTGTSGVGLQNLAFGPNQGLGLGFQFTVLVPAQQSGLLTLYVGSYSGEDTLVASAPGGASSTGTFNPGAGNSDRGFFTVALSNTTGADQTFSFSDYESSNNGADGNYNNPKITAAALALTPLAAAPEPSGVAALAVGLLSLGALTLRARRRSSAVCA